MVKLVDIIQPVEKQQIRAEGDDYDEAKAALSAQIPEGWQLLSIVNERSLPVPFPRAS
ncbi:hypothetical protein [Pseudarthrobacter albicanus]|uniref:hypothetical protein n=1 Tax=Pseudarthrobacter albicanus TaxID=2823873 RepID=UPI001BAD93C7|nr:hypothetical protein [Pseudarthrobacter albicanus]